MKKNKSAKHKNSNLPFNTIQDILDFEEKLFYDGMSLEEKKGFDLSISKVSSKPPKYKTLDYSKSYYWSKRNTFVFPSSNGFDELLKNNEIIPFAKYYLSLRNNQIVSDKPQLSFSAEPIIFKQKGKTPLSVRYLKVIIESELGDDDVLYDLHQKTI